LNSSDRGSTSHTRTTCPVYGVLFFVPEHMYKKTIKKEVDYYMRVIEQEYVPVGEEQQGWAEIKESSRIKKVLYADAVGLEVLGEGAQKEEVLKLKYKGIYGYLPKSRIDNYEFKGLHHFLGKEFEFVVEKVDLEAQWFLANRIEALEVSARRFWKSAQVGNKLLGFIRGMDASRLFLLVEGVPAVLERDEVSYSFIEDMRNEFEIGDLIKVKVTDLEAPTEENPDGELKVSAKLMERDPFLEITNFKIGSTYIGEIKKVHPQHGVFYELEGIPGLTVRTNFPPNGTPDLLKKGKKGQVKLLDIDVQNRMIKAITIIPERAIRRGRRVIQ